MKIGVVSDTHGRSAITQTDRLDDDGVDMPPRRVKVNLGTKS